VGGYSEEIEENHEKELVHLSTQPAGPAQRGGSEKK
jgi:hypothetical protein